ncbi:hypothetical protein GCM10010210_22470 [Pseudonocardia hydrocarbonoxydans]|uniref:Uncharacterized protein n=1 Tax=Pseudonocardia hydrocarbonoxydans TaxID=76726 RepID=A0A4Y3WN61_9PSEU|nr:hypothetical protein PHY01_25280 [Pseudonocardia hydrocarbonoxydans]
MPNRRYSGSDKPGSARTRHRSEIGGGAAGWRSPHGAPEGYRVEGWATRRDYMPCTPPLDPEGFHPRREEITTDTRARTCKNGPRGLCTDAAGVDAAPPQVKAMLTVHCKSVGLAYEGSNPSPATPRRSGP